MISWIKILHNKRWLYSCLLVFIQGCNDAPTYNQLVLSKADSIKELNRVNTGFITVDAAKHTIRHGDLILRTGNDFTSESLRKFSQTDKTYSHCGIASIENDSVFVYHALGGEWNPDQKLRRDPVELFCNPIENRGFGIYTFNFSPQSLKRLDSVVRSWYSRQLTFDMDFSLASDDRLYCAEFVCKSINLATNDQIKFSTTTLKDLTFYSVDNIFLNQHCVEKKRYRF